MNLLFVDERTDKYTYCCSACVYSYISNTSKELYNYLLVIYGICVCLIVRKDEIIQ